MQHIAAIVLASSQLRAATRNMDQAGSDKSILFPAVLKVERA